MPISPEQDAAIAELRTATTPTLRATVPGLEAMLYHALPVLDHGFVRVVDYMGDDAAVVQAARVSYGRGTKRVSEDAGLIRYLMRHRHSTPFEMCEIKYHGEAADLRRAPMDPAPHGQRERVFRPLLRHGPGVLHPRAGTAGRPIREQPAGSRRRVWRAPKPSPCWTCCGDDAGRTHDHYTWMLNEDAADPARRGLARELARMNLTLNTYTQWYWKTDLHNLLGFLSLRADPHAQYEIRAYADVMMQGVEAWVPATAAAFRDYRLGAVTFSAGMLAVLRRRLAGEAVDQPGSGLSKREWAELEAALA